MSILSNNRGRKSYTLFIVVIAICLILIVTYQILNNYSETTQLIVKPSTDVQQESHQLFMNKRLNRDKLNDFSVQNENGENFKISQLINENVIIFRFGELNCESCIFYEIDNLRSLIKQERLKLSDVLLLGRYKTFKHLKIFKTLNNINEFSIYNISGNAVGNLEIEDINFPFYLVLNEDLEIVKSFVPIKGQGERTRSFIEKTISN